MARNDLGENANRLFVYGTLHPDRAPQEIAAVVARLREVGRGTVRGRRFELGEYPGVVLDAASEEVVEGVVFEVDEDFMGGSGCL